MCVGINSTNIVFTNTEIFDYLSTNNNNHGEACFSFLRKQSLCWAHFVIPEVFLFQFRSCEICTPRNLMFSTLSTVRPLMLRGVCSGCDLQKSMINSFVLSALSTRLFSLHQTSRCLTSSLYIDSSFLSKVNRWWRGTSSPSGCWVWCFKACKEVVELVWKRSNIVVDSGGWCFFSRGGYTKIINICPI